MAIIGAKQYKVNEDVLKEIAILKYLMDDQNCPKSIVKYVESFKGSVNFLNLFIIHRIYFPFFSLFFCDFSKLHYYLVMEDGGFSLFEFVVKVHRLIRMGKLHISEWQRIAKIIFKQMIQAIEYIHSKGVCHFDISLENFILNDIDVVLVTTPTEETIKFVATDTSGIDVKLCDFGLAEIFSADKTDKNCNSKWLSNKYCGKVK